MISICHKAGHPLIFCKMARDEKKEDNRHAASKMVNKKRIVAEIYCLRLEHHCVW